MQLTVLWSTPLSSHFAERVALMSHRFSKLATAALLALSTPVLALDGQPRMHDPSTIIVHDGRFYSYGTGNGLPISVSDDGWTWRREGALMSAAPGGKPVWN